ncbi:hypothetical protein Agub_g2226 [Astrephomene gubernaculifera]|uniref:Protein kinase domain-containing protein n=1 Tax=Astrephomene gubernaculifera TaxID=47775 RepID=A0AAD3DGT2_9CHLO|nr:hypothetical protein Agub_g2226 [Astrephomene gubernaculifera]
MLAPRGLLGRYMNTWKWIAIYPLLFACLVFKIVDAGTNESLTFTLASEDGFYYPVLERYLDTSNYSRIVWSAQELRSLPLFNATTKSIPVTSTYSVISGSFFSIFLTDQVQLWKGENDTITTPAWFDVRDGGELLLVGFSLNWSPQVGAQFKTSTLMQLLYARLSLYVRLSGSGKLQLLRTTIEGLTCDGLERLNDNLTILASHPNLTQWVQPVMRYTFPYLFIKYGRLGPIWVEDLTVTCAANADLSPAACPPAVPNVYNVSSQEDILTALQAVGATNVRTCVTQRTILHLVSDITLNPYTWPWESLGVYITSNVTFEGQLGANTVLDFGLGLNLFKLRAAAYVQIRNLVIANLPLAPASGYAVPMWAFQYVRRLVPVDEGRVHLVNTKAVITPDEFVQVQYWSYIIGSPTRIIAALGGWQRLIQNITTGVSDSDSVTFLRLCAMGITGENLSLTTHADNVQSMRNETGVMQIIDLIKSEPPFVVAPYTAAQLRRLVCAPDYLLTRFAEQDGMTNGNSTPIVLLLQNNITLDRAVWPAAGCKVQRKVTIQGKPFADIWLDFGGGSSFFSAVGNGRLGFKYLTLRNESWLAGYNATVATTVSPLTFMQLGLWPVSFDRTSLTRVQVTSVTLLISRPELDVLLACANTYATNSSEVSTNTAVLDVLKPETCAQLFPSDTVWANTSGEAVGIQVSSMHLSAFDATDLLLSVDPWVTRPDLLQMLAASPSAHSATSGKHSGANGKAAIGGAIGGAAVCLLLALGAVLYCTHRHRRLHKHEEQLRGLQAKQTTHLLELSKTNPLAQVILDHLAGKDPGVAHLVLSSDAKGGSSECGQGVLYTPFTAAGAQGQVVKSTCGDCSTGGGEATTSGAAVGNTTSRTTPPDAQMSVAATDLVELFKHLTILGLGNMAAKAGGSVVRNSMGSDGCRVEVTPQRSSDDLDGSNPNGVVTIAVKPEHMSGDGDKEAPGGDRSTQEGTSSGLLGFLRVMGRRLWCSSSASSPLPTAASLGHGGTDAQVTRGHDIEPQGASDGARAESAGEGAKHPVDRDGCAADAGKKASSDRPARCEGEGADKAHSRGSSHGASRDMEGADVKAAAGKDTAVTAAVPTLPQGLQEHVTQSPVLEELLRLSVDLAGEIDDNQLIVTEVVACGGFGTVYKGMWHNLPVAVKVVLFSTASVNRRIALQEAALSKSISHPNIIATYAVDVKPMTVLRCEGSTCPNTSSGCTAEGKTKSLAEIQEWRLYIIQEFADGGTLRRMLDRGAFHDLATGLPRLDMLLDVAQGVAAALAHLHCKNVVHGDLNPKNVLLKKVPAALAARASAAGWGRPGGFPANYPGQPRPSNQHPQHPQHQAAAALAAASCYGSYPLAGCCGFAVKVADFGLSVKMEHSHMSGMRQGTPFYASPELAQQGIMSRAADTYAFGVLLWELYWGRPIWVPDSWAACGYVQHQDFPLLPPDCPTDYAALTAACLQANHLRRPGFEEVMARLGNLAQQLIAASLPIGNAVPARPSMVPMPATPHVSQPMAQMPPAMLRPTGQEAMAQGGQDRPGAAAHAVTAAAINSAQVEAAGAAGQVPVLSPPLPQPKETKPNPL